MLVFVLIVLLFLFTLGYVVPIAWFAAGLRRVLRQDPAPNAAYRPFVSVVVPARNEQDSIRACVASILSNDYPADRYEVIVVDDQSTDATVEVVNELARAYGAPVAAMTAAGGVPEEAERVRLLTMPENEHRKGSHKKYAIEKGVTAARGEIVLTTDADCTVGPAWIRTIVAQFLPDVGFVTGPVLYEIEETFFSRVQALEFLGFVSIGAGSVGIARPHLCNGANLAYRRDAFLELGGYEGIDHITSGDDELLMHKFAYDSPWRVRSCMSRAAVVMTPPNATARDLFEQRRRWASLDLHYTEPWLVVVSVLFYLFYVSLLVGAVVVFFIPSFLPILLATFAVKLVSEATLLLPASRHFGRARLFYRYFLPAQFLQIPYIVLIGAAGVVGGYTWKSRQIGR